MILQPTLIEDQMLVFEDFLFDRELLKNVNHDFEESSYLDALCKLQIYPALKIQIFRSLLRSL